jgi:hypothetical protein
LEVVAAANVADALRLIATEEKFDALITHLHMLNSGEAFVVVSAKRHTQPMHLLCWTSGYREYREAISKPGDLQSFFATNYQFAHVPASSNIRRFVQN